MRKFNLRMVSSLLVFLMMGSATAIPLSQDQFETKFYGTSEISHFGIDKQKFDDLNPTAREDLLGAKQVLLIFLKSLQSKNGNAHQYLTDSLNKKYPTEKLLGQFLIDEETSLLSLMIEKFVLAQDGRTIELTFSVVVSAEGEIVVAHKKATIEKVNSQWRLANIY